VTQTGKIAFTGASPRELRSRNALVGSPRLDCLSKVSSWQLYSRRCRPKFTIMPRTFTVTASWDPEARVFTSQSDIPGLVVEAETYEELVVRDITRSASGGRV
jgi:hypothetical protein